MFNIRVYGIWISEGRLLVTDEFRLGIYMTKLPGGGLEYGEGTLDCLKREWKEETGLDIEIISHYYTTDFFQPSFLPVNPKQVINIYYLIEVVQGELPDIGNEKFDFGSAADGAQSFRWLKIESMTEDDFTLPIDKVLAKKLKADFIQGRLISNPL